MRSRRVIGFGMLALLATGVGAGAALARTQSPAGVSSAGTSASASDADGWRGRFLDDAASSYRTTHDLVQVQVN